MAGHRPADRSTRRATSTTRCSWASCSSRPSSSCSPTCSPTSPTRSSTRASSTEVGRCLHSSGTRTGRRSRTPRLDRRAAEAGADYEVDLESLNQWQLAWRKFRRHRLALIGLGILAFMIVVAIIGPFLMPFDFDDIPQPGRDRLPGPRRRRSQHPFGETGGLQRDVLHARRQRRPDVADHRLLEHDRSASSSARSSARSPASSAASRTTS